MEEKEKIRHGKTLKAVLSVLHTHAASLAHAPRRSACLGSPRAQQETKQLPSSCRKPRGTRFRILIPSVTGPAPATAAVVTRTAGNDHAHSGLGFPFNPRDRTEVFIKDTPAVSLNLGLLSSIAAGRPQRVTLGNTTPRRTLVTPLPLPPRVSHRNLTGRNDFRQEPNDPP